MKKLLVTISLIVNASCASAVDVEDDVRTPQTVEANKKDENYEDKKAAEEIKAKKEKKYHERTHRWMDRVK